MVIVGDKQHDGYRHEIIALVQEKNIADVVDFIPFSMSARAENLAKAKVLLVPSVKE
jgi:hypothetical protein